MTYLLAAAKPHKEEIFFIIHLIDKSAYTFNINELRKELDFYAFGQNLKTVVRTCKHLNTACIWAIEHIRIKSIVSFDKLAVRKKRKKLFAKVQNYKNL